MGAAPVFFSSLLLLLSLSIAHPAKPDFPRSGNDDADHLRRLPVGNPLRFSADATFKIALFADLHYGENAWTDWGPAQDDHSDRVMSVVLDAENPGDDVDDDMHFSHSQIVWDGIDERNFVIYLGDVITANNLPIANATSYWDRALSSVRSRGIPWSTVFGNHDDAPFEWPSEWFSATGIPNVICPSAEFSFTDSTNCSFEGTTRVQLISTEINNNWLSYTMSGPKSLWPSVSNYMLQVFSSKDPNAPVVYFYFLDSGGGSYPEVVSNAQAQWLLRQLQEVNPNARIPEVIFWHIPSTAYKKIAPKPFFKIRKPCVGSINKERVAPQEAEWGVMDILFDRPSVKAVFAGHNHGLDWCCPCKHIWLCFARHTGYGGYGNWPRGSRIVTLTEQPFSINTWIRMEDGTEHSHVVLSN